jgi:acylphosphatase
MEKKNDRGASRRVHVLISGRVQGVGYRYFAERCANELGLTGWIRNLHDGRVEVVAEGPGPKLDEFLGRLRTGPRLAVVEDFKAVWQEFTGEFGDFRVTFPGWWK